MGFRTRAALVTLAACAACTIPAAEPHEEEHEGLPPVDTTLERQAPVRLERPDSMVDTILLEGAPEPMLFRLYRPTEGFPLRFSTYVPRDLGAEEVASGEGDAVRFTARFAGGRDERALLAFQVPADLHDAAAARRRTEEEARLLGAAERVTGGGLTWALEEYRFRTGERAGTVALGRHAGTYFLIRLEYPPEMGDGFLPRAHRILAEWRWEDGSRLGS